MNPDGTLPQAPPLYWVEHNTFRARPVIDASPVDFQVAITDVCTAGCGESSPVKVGVQVHSAGPMIVPAGLTVTLYTEGPEGARALETQTMGMFMPGRVTNVDSETTLADVDGGELFVRVDDIGTGSGLWAECDESNNTDRWGQVSCDR